jgi:hypothetical protein
VAIGFLDHLDTLTSFVNFGALTGADQFYDLAT